MSEVKAVFVGEPNADRLAAALMDVLLWMEEEGLVAGEFSCGEPVSFRDVAATVSV